jgi:hypothetical protein
MPMNILLVNTNPVVSRLLSLHSRRDFTIDVDEIKGGEPIPRGRYDIVFVDEQCCHIRQIEKYLQGISAAKKIVLSSGSDSQIDWADGVIKKPFLPSEISKALSSYIDSFEDDLDDLDDLDAFFEESLYDSSLSVLNRDEIKKIQYLLENEESQEFEELVVPKKEEGIKVEDGVFENKLLVALMKMKPKKIKKLLQGAEVTVTIKFPKEEEQ